MGIYGFDFYGAPTRYGATPLVEFDARPFEAVSIDYGKVLVTWAAPSGSWDMLRLVRDPNGYTPRADMGKLLLESPATGAPTSYLDIDPLTEGEFYYYTVWVRATLDGLWRRAADTTALAVKRWRYSERLYEFIPMVYRDKDADTVGAKIHGQGPLERFLTIFGFQLDHIRSEYETLKQVVNPDKVSGGLLPLMTRQIGFGFEQELGMRLARIQARNAVHLYKLKGTRLGVEGFASVMTGWGASVTTGTNLVLDQNDSSFEENSGRWANVSNTILGRRNTGTAPAIAGPVPAPSGASTGDIGSGDWMLTVTAAAAGDMVIESYAAGLPIDNRFLGIPVVGLSNITLSIYSRAMTTARTVTLALQFYDAAGAAVGALASGAGVANTTTGWVRPTVSAAVPVGAVTARLRVTVASAAANEVHLLEAVQVESGTAATAFQDARQTRIRFDPERINHNPNPSVEVNSTGWGISTASGTGYNAVRDTTVAHTGSASFRADLPANVALGIFVGTGYTAMPAVAGRTYTVSIYVRPTIATTVNIETAFWRVPFNTGAAADVIGPDIAIPANVWTRVSRTVVAPAGNNTLEFRLNLKANAVAHSVYMDTALIEEGALLGDYFDGQNTSNEGEYIWEGTGGNSRTLYYSRRLIKNYRMNQRIKEFLPAGSTYKLLYSAS